MAETWDETKPAGSRSPALGDDDIREFKVAIRERLAIDHDFEASESPAFGASGATIGYHKKVMLIEQAASPTIPDDAGALYTMEADGKAELHWKDEDDNQVQITKAGRLYLKDLNGEELILDADGDTSITADTDDQIDFKIGGSDVASLKSTGLTLGASQGVIINSVAQGKDVTAALHRKIVEIGDWNMDSTVGVTVAHGLTLSKIRKVSIMIRNDADDVYQDLIGSSVALAGYFNMNASNVYLYRVAGVGFDGAGFDSTSFNRGWIIIDYVD